MTWVRFGWIDSTDWIGQKAATGQQCRLPPDVEENKFVTIYRKAKPARQSKAGTKAAKALTRK